MELTPSPPNLIAARLPFTSSAQTSDRLPPSEETTLSCPMVRETTSSCPTVREIRKACELPSTSIHAPIWHNHALPPSFTDSAFRDWSRKGIVTVEDFYINGHFASFEQLVSKISLSKAQFSGIYS